MQGRATSTYMRLPTLPLLLTAFSFAPDLRADVTLASLFSDHAVLQRDKPIPVWGRADPGEKVAVSFLDQTVHATAGPSGRWIVYLDPSPARSQGTELVVTAKNLVTFRDVVVGEVWLCAGGAGMEQPLVVTAASPEATEILARADLPLIRQIKIERTSTSEPAEMVQTSGWKLSSPVTARAFSGVGYFFAREIYQKLGVPVGLVNSSAAHSPLETWLSAASISAATAAQAKAEVPVINGGQSSGQVGGPSAIAGRGAPGASTAGAFFNGMINPLLPYGLRGVLWSHGESDIGRAENYGVRFSALVAAWRSHFGQEDFPFYWVQLPAHRAFTDQPGNAVALLRHDQGLALELPYTGQAIALDLGGLEAGTLVGQGAIGQRLALLAKNRTYEITGDDSGPTFLSATSEGARMRVRFTHASSGLIAHDKPLQSFEVAGADRVFRGASARIEGETLLVSSPEVKLPIAVRYGWRNAPEANLHNGAGLPAPPFRSDDW